MAETLIVVVLITIGAVLVVSLFGDNIRLLLGASADALSGQRPLSAMPSEADLADQEQE